MSTESTAELEAPTRGRPRKFNDDEVLDALVQLFWEHGYEATSMADIVAATGLNKSSLYSSFGSKDELFEMALSRYVDFRTTMLSDVVGNGTRGLDDIKMFFDYIWVEVNEMGEQRGCLAVNTSAEMGQRDQGVADIGTRYRNLMRDGITKAFSRAADAGEIPSDKVDSYASMIVSFIIGTAVIVRSGAPNDEVESHLEAAKAVIDGWRIS
jgi:AcrR family transcriptional regulator